MKLRQSEKRFQTLADATFEGVVLSQSGIIIDCNQQFLNILARPREDIIGCSIADLVAVDRVEEVMRGILTGENVTREQTLVRADGSQRIVEIRGYSPDGAAGTRFSIFRDVTEQRDMERELVLQRERLARFQRMAELSAMSAGVLHQAGQPLTAVFNNISAAAVAVSECSNPSCIAPEAIQDSLRCLKNVQRTIARLRALTHPDRAHREWADLNELVGEVLGLLKSEIKSHGVRVNLRLAADLPPVSLDDVQLSQALLNVLRNACEAMIECPLSERVLTIGTRTLRPGWVELCVTDQGSGINPEHPDRIFEPFFSTKPGGMGVGLSLCQAVVEAHGGNLTADNNSDAPGATFRFHLPVGEGERS